MLYNLCVLGQDTAYLHPGVSTSTFNLVGIIEYWQLVVSKLKIPTEGNM